MTRELAILGIPTISVYQDDLLDVDSFLLSKGLMLHEPSLTPEKVESYIKSLQNTPPSLELMEKGKAAYKLFKQENFKIRKEMIKIALIGAGKMGLSHLAILGAHPDVQIVGVADTSKMVTDVLEKYSGFNCFADYKKMLDATKPEAVVVAAPTKYHGEIVGELLKRGIHVFAEKPFA